MNENAFLKLENTWNHISTCESNDDKYTRECLEATSLKSLSKTCGLIQKGLIPSPETLKTLADDFEIYLQSEGQVSLEQVFFGTPKNKPGLFARTSRKRFIDLVMDTEKQAGSTYASIVEKLIDKLGYQIEPESFIKAHDRRKK